MWKRIVLCLTILSLLLTACGQKTDTDPDTVNIMCLEYQARVIKRVYGSFSDAASPTLHFITESGYESVLKWQEDLHKNLLAHSPGIDIYCLDRLGRMALYGMRSLTGLASNLDTHNPPVYRYAGSYPDDWYTQAQLDHVGSMLKKMDVGFRFPGFDQVLSACIEYIEGDATLDKAVAESQHIIDMARKEQYIGEE